ncbi:hypothetical protein T4E_2507 [Trichinella pseudospiralis]|uniref:Uncharacterized protein n=1 Tax=Trichinella pseudospiralis TaxID=6337 RepID=A0A0V0XUG1_TRIPS|nr:hypothetical protein T4E_2507 [Trichinella pseudospiralis]
MHVVKKWMFRSSFDLSITETPSKLMAISTRLISATIADVHSTSADLCETSNDCKLALTTSIQFFVIKILPDKSLII